MISCKLYFLALFALLFACRTAKMPQQPVDIYFGFGGGFTGMRNEYRILQNGSMYKMGLDGTPEKEWKHPKVKKLIPIFTLADSVRKFVPQKNEPGNMYQYIRWGSDSYEYLYMWNISDTTIHEPVRRLFHQLITTQMELESPPAKK